MDFDLTLGTSISHYSRVSGKSIDETFTLLQDEIDPKIEESLKSVFGITYYSYSLAKGVKTNVALNKCFYIIEYFLSNCHSKFHNQIIGKIFVIVNKRFTKFSREMQTYTNRCLEIMDQRKRLSTAHMQLVRGHLLSYASPQLIKYCLSSLHCLIDSKCHINKTVSSILATEKFLNFNLKVRNKRKFILLFVSILLELEQHKSPVFKALMLQCNDPSILHISMNSCQRHMKPH